MGKKTNNEQHFWKKVDIKSENECWLYKGALDEDGYGVYNIDWKNVRAHVYAWEVTNKRKRNKDMIIGHAPIVCHNRACCNPKHLSEKTHQENQQDRILDGTDMRGDKNPSRLHPERMARGDKNGARLYAPKLTMEKARQIRKEYVFRKNSAAKVAEKFGVSRSFVLEIISGKRWSE